LNNDPENLIFLTASVHTRITHMTRKDLDVAEILAPFFSHRSMCLKRMRAKERQKTVRFRHALMQKSYLR
jgi:hypothetical protein